MDSQEIPLPHDIKPIIRVWDPTAVLIGILGIVVLAALIWVGYRWWKRLRRKGTSAEAATDWRQVAQQTLEQGEASWQLSQCEKFYWSLRQLLGDKSENRFASLWRRSEEAVFGGRLVDFQVAQADWQSIAVIGSQASLEVRSSSPDELRYPSEVAESRYDAIRKGTAPDASRGV